MAIQNKVLNGTQVEVRMKLIKLSNANATELSGNLTGPDVSGDFFFINPDYITCIEQKYEIFHEYSEEDNEHHVVRKATNSNVHLICRSVFEVKEEAEEIVEMIEKLARKDK